MDNELLDLDDKWIIEFEQLEQFYKAPLEYITVHFIYINGNSEISSVKKENIFIDNNTFTQEQLIHTIKKNMIFNKYSYSLFSILKYNITDEPKHLMKIEPLNESSLEIMKQLNEIHFKDTIKCFQDINSIFLIFFNPVPQTNKQQQKQVKKKSQQTTRKIYIQPKTNTTRRR